MQPSRRVRLTAPGTYPLAPHICAQINRVTKMLQDEYGTASNIKSRVNRLSVLSAITSAQQRLKLYNRVRPAAPDPHADAPATAMPLHVCKTTT